MAQDFSLAWERAERAGDRSLRKAIRMITDSGIEAQTVMSGRTKFSFVDFTAFQAEIARVRCASSQLFLVRKLAQRGAIGI
jgi:hypothetical protein